MLLVESLLGSSSAAGPTYIEDVFSTYLYTGTGATQFISNSIQLGGGTTSGWITTLATGSGNGIAADSSGNTYVCGTSGSNIQIVKFNSSGNVEWQRSLASVASEEGTSIAVDSSGNVYICGYSATSGNNNIILAKYNTSGTIQWQRSLGGSATEFGFSIAVDSSSNVYICGSSNTSGSASLLVAKYDTSGTIQWQRTLSSSFDEYGYSIAVDSSSNVYVGGVHFVSGVTPNFLLVKYNTSGTIQWQRILDGIKGIDAAIAVDSAGNVFGCETQNSNDDIQIFKYDTSGTLQWQRRLGSGSTERGYSVAVDSAGNAYICGQSNTSGTNDVVIAKYNTSGTLQWQRSLASTSNDFGYSIAIDATGSLYMAGSSGGNFLAAKLPTDGTGIGQYTIGATTFTYGVTSFADNSTTHTGATSTLTDATASFTDAASSLTDAATSLTVSTGTVPGPGKGGMVWIKGRSGATDHALYDTTRGATFDLASNLTTGQTTQATGLTAFTSSGFSIGALAKLNTSAATYASWSFRKQAKFFDVVTYTGNGAASRNISHGLTTTPGCVIVKQTNSASDWIVRHRTYGNNNLILNSTDRAGLTYISAIGNLTSTTFTVGEGSGTTNVNGATYVAYLFAHNAGGFGLTGTDNVITCDSYTGNGSATGPVVTLGYEPQWLLIKRGDTTGGDWNLIDNMRGFVVGGTDSELNPNLSNAESTGTFVTPTATGFQLNTTDAGYNANTGTYIYIAIRRGPMKTPTTGTGVFGLNARTGTGANATVTGGQTDDVVLIKNRGSAVGDLFAARLTGTRYLETSSTAGELTAGVTALQTNPWDVMDGVKVGTTSTITNASANTYINYLFRRSPGFFDVVCYTGTTAQQTVSHNLGAIPELIIAKVRSNIRDWVVYYGTLDRYLVLNTTAAFATDAGYIVSTSASNFVAGASEPLLNENGENYIAYLFATVAGVSKVGSYTGTGTTRQINCGFTGGARFVLIKRTDSTGDWYVWDSARGIVAGNDPYLLLNSTAAEVTSTDYIDTYSAGFELSSTAPAALNANGGTFIFLAIA